MICVCFCWAMYYLSMYFATVRIVLNHAIMSVLNQRQDEDRFKRGRGYKTSMSKSI